MSLFRKREAPETYTDDVLLRAMLRGEEITRDKAMALPSVSANVSLISDMIASVPVRLYKIREGKVEEVTNDSRTRLLNGDTGDLLNGFQLKKALTEDYLMSSGGYVYIRRRRNEVTGLFYVSPGEISIVKSTEPIFKSYRIYVAGKEYKPYDFLSFLRSTKDGSEGTGIVSEVGKSLETAYQTLLYQLGLVKSGGNKKGFLKSQRRLGDEELKTLKNAWKNLYRNNEENVVVLNSGLEFQESSNSSVEMQLNENKKTLNDEINDIFHVHPESFDLTFKEAIYPIIKAFEATLNQNLLLEREKKNMFFAFDTKEIIKANISERYSAYKTAKETGFLTLNEIRRLENLDYIEGLDVVNVGLSAVLYDVNTKQYYTPNTDTKADLRKAPLGFCLDFDSKKEENERYNKNHDGKTGRFAPGKGAGGQKSSGKYAKVPRAKMSAREKSTVSHAIATDFPRLKAGNDVRTYRHGNYAYRFTVKEFGSYNFIKRSKLK